ncbi:MAG: hypothetical protein HPY30_04830 [Gammaproteobacteria bacterium (ex Lamellibrachia satsuma)]|nr:MAG: hypothetical protein HPY30_04830 [Gammaproteobacteria bacterium (ex Lamellibrachia satsuma)]
MAQFIAYPKAFSRLADRIGATQDEMAAWIFLGPENGGLAAYLNANELNPPSRFHYSLGNECDFDYLSPLMACWFLEDDIANYQPEERYITGEELIERWGEQPGIEPQAIIGAKIAEGRLFDMHPIFGCTRFSGTDDDSFPPLKSGLFALSYVEAIEEEDFGLATILPTEKYSPWMTVEFEKFHTCLITDTFYGKNSTASKNLIKRIYDNKSNNALYDQFRHQFHSRPWFRNDKQRELLYLWCVLIGLPVYRNGLQYSWQLNHPIEQHVQGLEIKLDELRDFLRQHSWPLPSGLFPNEVDCTYRKVTLDKEEYDRAFHEAIEVLPKLQKNLEELERIQPASMEERREKQMELDRITLQIDSISEHYFTDKHNSLSEKTEGKSQKPTSATNEVSVDNDNADVPNNEWVSAFDPLPLSGIARMFPLDRDEQNNLDIWKTRADKASRNGLIKARISTGTGNAESTFDPWEVSEWLIDKGHYTRDKTERKLANNLPTRSAHLKDLIRP